MPQWVIPRVISAVLPVFHHRCTIHRLWKKGDVLDRRISFEQQGQKRWAGGEDLARHHGDLSRGKKREHDDRHGT